MMYFNSFADLQTTFLNLSSELSNFQEEISPELFEQFANALMDEFKNNYKLYLIENNRRFLKRKSKYLRKLNKRGWKKILFKEYQESLRKKNVTVPIKEKAEIQTIIIPESTNITKIENAPLIDVFLEASKK